MIKREYPLVVIKKVEEGGAPTKYVIFFLSFFFYYYYFYCSGFYFPFLLLLSCVSVRKPKAVFCALHKAGWIRIVCKRWGWTHVCLLACRSPTLHDSKSEWAQRAEGGGQSLADKSPRGNLSFSSQNLTQWLWHFLPRPPLFHFFQKTLHFRPGMLLIPQNGRSKSSLGNVLPAFLQTNSVMQGREGYCLDVKSTTVEGGTGARMEGQSPLPGPGLGGGSTERREGWKTGPFVVPQMASTSYWSFRDCTQHTGY